MRNSHLTTYMLPVVPFHENLQARRWRSENLDVNVVVMPCGLATLEANLAAGDAQALRQVRLDENAGDLRLVHQPGQHPGGSLLIETPFRRLRLEPLEIPAQRRPPSRAGQRVSLTGLLVDEITEPGRRAMRDGGARFTAAIEVRDIDLFAGTSDR